VRQLRYSIQNKLPSRGPRTKVEPNKQSVFADNWIQQVVLDVTGCPSRSSRVRTTTQCRLDVFLRFGDINQLEGESDDP